MNDMLLSVWEDYLKQPGTRDYSKYFVKSETDTNDADYIYGMAMHTPREIVSICINMAYEFSKSDSKRYDGQKSWEIWRYHDNGEFPIDGLSEFVDTLTISFIPKECRSWLREQFPDTFGDVVYTTDFETSPDEFADVPDILNLSDELIKKHGWIFFDQLNREIYQDLERSKRNLKENENILVTGTGRDGEPLEEKWVKAYKDSIARDSKAIERWQKQLDSFEPFMTHFPKPEN